MSTQPKQTARSATQRLSSTAPAGADTIPRYQAQLCPVLHKHVACRLLRVDAHAVCFVHTPAQGSGSIQVFADAVWPERGSTPLVMIALVWAGTLNCPSAHTSQPTRIHRNGVAPIL